MSKQYPNLIDYKQDMHLSLAKEHRSVWSGVIEWPNNPIDGKKFMCFSRTAKISDFEYGETETEYYLQDSPELKFGEINEFVNHYKQLQDEKAE